MFVKKRIYKYLISNDSFERNMNQDIYQMSFIKDIALLFPYGNQSNFHFHVFNRPSFLNTILPGALLSGEKIVPDEKELSFKFYANCKYIIKIEVPERQPMYFISETLKYIKPYYL